MRDQSLARESDSKRHLNVEGLARGQPWGKLVKVDSSETQVLLVKRECTVGRSKGCDLSFPANQPWVSGNHCKIIQDECSGQVWLEDMSTHGTVINMSTLVKKQTHRLQNGDVIYFVYRKNEPEQNIAYVFHSIQPERVVSQDDSSVGPNATDVMEDRSSHRQTVPEPAVLPGPPRHPTRKECQAPSSSTSCPAAAGPLVHTCCNSFAPGQAKKRAPTKETCTHIQEPERKKRRKTKYDKGHDLSLPKSSRTEGAGPPKGSLQDPLGKAPSVEGTKTDTMEESLTCTICQDLLYDCVSLQPCMHTFCAACYSGWMERSALCPACRGQVERINKNHILNNLVEAYLIQHPEKCRSEEDKKSMDSRNKITRDMLQPKVERSFSDEEGSSDDLFDELFELSDDDDDSQPFVIYRRYPSSSSSSSSSYWLDSSDEEDSSDTPAELSDSDSDASGTSQPSVTSCRQCPGYRKVGSRRLFQLADFAGSPASPSLPFQPSVTPTLATQGPEESPGKLNAGEEPSTSAITAPPEYSCSAQGNHILCTCCLQPMPDRHGELGSQQVPAQQCMLCQLPFCHMYWGCQRTGCRGCLAHFSELNLTDKCPDGVLNSNKHESEILANYLYSRSMSWKDMLREALQALQQGIFDLSDYRINADVVVCFSCGLQCFNELAYKYRQNIPASDLPASVTSRPDCYWGRNCRTQVRAHHAMKFNHICEQTRFKR